MKRAHAILLAGLAGFVVLGVLYDHDPLGTIDAGVAEWVAANMPSWAEWLARPFTWVGGSIGTLSIGAVLVAVLVSKGRALEAAWAAVTLAGVHVAVSPFLKEAFDRPRPTAGSAVPLPSSDAFPSGHASGAVVAFGLLALVAAERWTERRRLVWAAAGVLAFAIGASRAVLGVHHLTDVVGGWCFGVAWLAAALLVRPTRSRSHRYRP